MSNHRRNWREQALPESVRRDAVLPEGAHLRVMNIRGIVTRT